MSKSLIIVESPAKARTISRFFDKGVKVVASMGHIRDLPGHQLGIDVANSFKPRYVLTDNGKKVINNLRKEVAAAEEIYLATDPDREGEAIAWHVKEALSEHTNAQFHRVAFHEITAAAVKQAFAEQQDIDSRKVDAQQARRILDRLVGYKVSPLLWKHVGRGTSAGRVQSVALRLVCERERAIQNFISEEYWTLTAHFSPLEQELSFPAHLFKLDGRKPQIPNAETANRLASEIDGQSFAVSDRKVSPKQQRPSPPFITSTLQQVAGARMRMTTRQTMSVAQQLYEGVELGGSGPSGLITYMRTDSFAIAKDAQKSAREYISAQYGADYVPEKPNVYRSRQSAQEAHEAIRPTDVERTPEKMAGYLSAPQLKLYRLIWQRFVASQMAPAKLRQTALEIKPATAELEHDYLFRTTVTETLFPGFTKVFEDRDIDAEEENKKKEKDIVLPELKKGDPCKLLKLDKEQSFTQPPKRFSEATLVRELEHNGVGRPSTYASIVNTIQERKYVEREKSRLIPTELGFKVNDYLIERIDRIFQVNFTAEMENQLDAIEDGQEDMVHMLERFYQDFIDSVKEAELLDAPDSRKVKRVLDLFPANMQWREPDKIGKRTYDDQKFYQSLKEQVEDKEKPLSDKQWRALLALAARYSEQLPGFEEVVEELGIGEEIKQLIEHNQDRDRKEKENARNEPAAQSLIEALEKVEWQPPEKRKGKVYDDRKFFQSLKKQRDQGRNLSAPQLKALKQLALRYREQIPALDQLLAEHNIEAKAGEKGGPEELSSEEKEKINKLMALTEQISEWKPARKVRGRTYDDRQFVESLRQQWHTRGSLSSRQLAALRKTIGKYRSRIPDYEAEAEELSLPPPESSRQKDS